MGWFDGPFFSYRHNKHRWVLHPVAEFLTAAYRDLGSEGGEVEVVKEEGWEWVSRGGHEVQGGGRRGWRVLQEGLEVEGSEGTGALSLKGL